VGDEWGEALLARQIFSGQALPLHNRAHDIGALFNYLLAALLKVVGPSLFAPRVFVMAVSIGTVFLTYILGRMLFGRWVGLLASALLATDAADILVTHMAWSNDVTPFFVVLATLILALGMSRGRWWLVLAGFAWGLALQTHSSVAAFLPAVVALAVWGRQGEVRSQTRWVIAGVGAFLVGYGNMIAYNIIHPLGSLRWVLATKSYAFVPARTPAAYFTHLFLLVEELARSLLTANLKSAIFLHHFPGPILILSLLLWAAGFAMAIRRRSLLLPALVLGPILIYPLLNQSYAFIVDTRYIDALVPLGLIFVAMALIGAAKWVLARAQSRWRPAFMAGLAALGVVLVLSPIPSLQAYYEAGDRSGLSNAPLYQVSLALQKVAGGHLILIDSTVDFARNLPAVLAYERLRDHLVGNAAANRGHGTFDAARWAAELRAHPQAIVVVSPQDLARLLGAARPEILWSSPQYVIVPARDLSAPPAGAVPA